MIDRFASKYTRTIFSELLEIIVFCKYFLKKLSQVSDAVSKTKSFYFESIDLIKVIRPLSFLPLCLVKGTILIRKSKKNHKNEKIKTVFKVQPIRRQLEPNWLSFENSVFEIKHMPPLKTKYWKMHFLFRYCQEVYKYKKGSVKN